MCVEQVFSVSHKTQYMGVELPLESHTTCPFSYLAVPVDFTWQKFFLGVDLG